MTKSNPAKPVKAIKLPYGTGRRKTAIARVWLVKSGTGKITVNGKSAEEYFGGQLFNNDLYAPFVVTNSLNSFDCICKVKSGGKAGQRASISLGISRALLEISEDYRPLLRAHNLLTRDSRMVERKKYGKKKARKSFQFSKR